MRILTRLRDWFKKISGHLPIHIGMLVLVILATLGFTLLWLQCMTWYQRLSDSFSILAAITGIGIGAALLSQLVFRQERNWMRLLSAFAGMIVSLIFFNNLTPEIFNASQLMGDPAGNLNVFWQGVVGGGIILVALFPWRKRILRTPESITRKRNPARRTKKFTLPSQSDFIDFPGFPRIEINKTTRKRSTSTQSGQQRIKPKVSRITTPTAHPKKDTSATSKLPGKKLPGLKIQKSKAPVDKPGKTAGGGGGLDRKGKNNTGIRLMGDVEHRCPYCLDIVDINDPEGVVVCNICHSYHHKKCWEVTGSCQVPHLHA